jgi:hypothetical protein
MNTFSYLMNGSNTSIFMSLTLLILIAILLYFVYGRTFKEGAMGFRKILLRARKNIHLARQAHHTRARNRYRIKRQNILRNIGPPVSMDAKIANENLIVKYGKYIYNGIGKVINSFVNSQPYTLQARDAARDRMARENRIPTRPRYVWGPGVSFAPNYMQPNIMTNTIRMSNRSMF